MLQNSCYTPFHCCSNQCDTSKRTLTDRFMFVWIFPLGIFFIQSLSEVALATAVVRTEFRGMTLIATG